MSAVERIHQLPLTPRDLALNLLNEATDDGDLNWEPRFVKALQGRHRGLLEAALLDLARLYADGKTPKKVKLVLTGIEKVVQSAARKARRDYLAAQVDVAAEKRALMNIIMPNGKSLGDCTQGYIAHLGGAYVKLGKPGGKKLIKQVFTERDLERAKIK